MRKDFFEDPIIYLALKPEEVPVFKNRRPSYLDPLRAFAQRPRQKSFTRALTQPTQKLGLGWTGHLDMLSGSTVLKVKGICEYELLCWLSPNGWQFSIKFSFLLLHKKEAWIPIIIKKDHVYIRSTVQDDSQDTSAYWNFQHKKVIYMAHRYDFKKFSTQAVVRIFH